MLVGEHVEPLRRVGDDVAKPLVDAQVAVLDLVQDDLQHDHIPNGGILQVIDFVEEDVRVRHEAVRVRAEVRVHASPAKNSYGSIVVMICDYRLNSKKFVHDDCTCFVRFTQASYKRRGFNKSRL